MQSDRLRIKTASTRASRVHTYQLRKGGGITATVIPLSKGIFPRLRRLILPLELERVKKCATKAWVYRVASVQGHSIPAAIEVYHTCEGFPFRGFIFIRDLGSERLAAVPSGRDIKNNFFDPGDALSLELRRAPDAKCLMSTNNLPPIC